VATLDRLGWKPDLDELRTKLEGEGYVIGRVVRVDRGQCEVGDGERERTALLLGKVAGGQKHLRPAVGDWVAMVPETASSKAVIHETLPRRSSFSRSKAISRSKAEGSSFEQQVVAANVDTVLLMIGLDADYNLRRLERMLTLAWDSGARPVVVLTKADLAEDLDAMVDGARAASAGADVLPVSVKTGVGIDAIAAYRGPGQTIALLGTSGVGKSTMVNHLLGEERMATGAVRESDGRGRHTTTRRELISLDDGTLLVDTPGMRTFGLIGEQQALDETFEEITRLAVACRFGNCRHLKEPGCAVRSAIAAGDIDPARFASYSKLEREDAHSARAKQTRRTHERETWGGIRKLARDQRRLKSDGD